MYTITMQFVGSKQAQAIVEELFNYDFTIYAHNAFEESMRKYDGKWEPQFSTSHTIFMAHKKCERRPDNTVSRLEFDPIFAGIDSFNVVFARG